MTELDVPKIREECLKLMGITRRPCAVLYEDASGQPLPTFLGTGFTGMSGFRQEIPDPTKSLDDALPLMEKFDIILSPIVGEGGWCASDEFGEPPRPMVANDSAPLAVCLLALDKSGRDLEDFTVKS